MSRELISIKTRRAFREQMVGWLLREISEEFDVARIACDLSYRPSASGQKRTLVDQYYHSVNWTDLRQIKKVLPVFETILRRVEQMARNTSDQWQQRWRVVCEDLIRCLGEDGFQWVGGKIVAGAGLSGLDGSKGAAAVFEVRQMAAQIRRMEAAVESNPGFAIGMAKELIETCCRTILAARGRAVAGRPDVPALIKETFKELKLGPAGVPGAARGAEVIKRLLHNLGTIGHDLAELSGLHGTGPGRRGQVTGLGPRHAKLAVGAAAALATYLFETHLETKP